MPEIPIAMTPRPSPVLRALAPAWRLPSVALALAAALVALGGCNREAPKERAEGTPDTPTTHFARHTTATVLMELGVDAKIIGEVVGHVSERTTRGYQHVSSPAARAALEALGDHFKDAFELGRQS